MPLENCHTDFLLHLTIGLQGASILFWHKKYPLRCSKPTHRTKRTARFCSRPRRCAAQGCVERGRQRRTNCIKRIAERKFLLQTLQYKKCRWSLPMGQITKRHFLFRIYTISVDVESSPEAYHWLRTKPPKSIMLCHNHPGQSYFSMQDIRKFLQYGSIRSMTVVTNQGKVWVISKTDKFESKAAYAKLIELSRRYGKDMDLIVDKFTRDGYNGVERL